MVKYPSGTKVRIRNAGDFRGPYSDFRRWESFTGQVVDSTPLAAYVAGPWAWDPHSPIQTIQAYRVHLDIGVEIDYVIEDCLEALDGS